MVFLSTNSLILKVSGENKYNEEKLVTYNSQSIDEVKDIRYINADIGSQNL